MRWRRTPAASLVPAARADACVLVVVVFLLESIGFVAGDGGTASGGVFSAASSRCVKPTPVSSRGLRELVCFLDPAEAEEAIPVRASSAPPDLPL